MGAAVKKYCFDSENKTLACMKSALGDTYYLLSVVLGGRTHKWFVDEFYKEEIKILDKNINIYDYLDTLAEEIQPGSGGLISINYLQGRFFPPDSNTRGLFIGHTWAHTKMHFYRSILESIGYDHYLTKEIIKELLPGQDFDNVTAIGSGNKSRFWMQIKADILQQPYQTLFRSDLSTLGSAIIAGYASGIFKDVKKVISDILKVKETIYPQEGADKKYLGYIDIYKNLFAALKESYRKISEIS
jgi:xylulokinase